MLSISFKELQTLHLLGVPTWIFVQRSPFILAKQGDIITWMK
jgi:hypothetical protein